MLFVVLFTNMLILFMYSIHCFRNILKFVISGKSHKEWLFDLQNFFEAIKYELFI